jgi:hypothetical protein
MSQDRFLPGLRFFTFTNNCRHRNYFVKKERVGYNLSIVNMAKTCMNICEDIHRKKLVFGPQPELGFLKCEYIKQLFFNLLFGARVNVHSEYKECWFCCCCLNIAVVAKNTIKPSKLRVVGTSPMPQGE